MKPVIVVFLALSIFFLPFQAVAEDKQPTEMEQFLGEGVPPSKSFNLKLKERKTKPPRDLTEEFLDSNLSYTPSPEEDEDKGSEWDTDFEVPSFTEQFIDPSIHFKKKKIRAIPTDDLEKTLDRPIQGTKKKSGDILSDLLDPSSDYFKKLEQAAERRPLDIEVPKEDRKLREPNLTEEFIKNRR